MWSLFFRPKEPLQPNGTRFCTDYRVPNPPFENPRGMGTGGEREAPIAKRDKWIFWLTLSLANSLLPFFHEIRSKLPNEILPIGRISLDNPLLYPSSAGALAAWFSLSKM
jgi:hypothetical protein